MAEVSMQADCGQCAALCCVAFAFDQRQGFAIDKRNGEVCPHLCESGKCDIHASRDELGFRGCISFDCLGAGQRVTQELFHGRSWQKEPQLLPAMADAFLGMLVVHELLELLGAVSGLPLSRKDGWILMVLSGRLSPEKGWSPDELSVFRQGRLERVIRRFLTTLRRYYQPAQGRLAVAVSASENTSLQTAS